MICRYLAYTVNSSVNELAVHMFGSLKAIISSCEAIVGYLKLEHGGFRAMFVVVVEKAILVEGFDLSGQRLFTYQCAEVLGKLKVLMTVGCGLVNVAERRLDGTELRFA